MLCCEAKVARQRPIRVKTTLLIRTNFDWSDIWRTKTLEPVETLIISPIASNIKRYKKIFTGTLVISENKPLKIMISTNDANAPIRHNLTFL